MELNTLGHGLKGKGMVTELSKFLKTNIMQVILSMASKIKTEQKYSKMEICMLASTKTASFMERVHIIKLRGL